MIKIISASLASLLLVGCATQQPKNADVQAQTKTTKVKSTKANYNAIKFPRCLIMAQNNETNGKLVTLGTDAQVTSMQYVFYGEFKTLGGADVNVMSGIIERDSSKDIANERVDTYYGRDIDKGITYSRTLDPRTNNYTFLVMYHGSKKNQSIVGYMCNKDSGIPFEIK